jgi:IclR family transcriptional regulator, KDG regulon repressor
MKTIEKAFNLMELMSEHGTLHVAEATNLLKINRTAAHRYLTSLTKLGYLTKKGRGYYQINFKIVQVAEKIIQKFNVAAIAKPQLQDLGSAYNETINLGYWNGKEIIHIDKVDSSEILRIDSPLGSAAPGYCTGLGKAILAFLPKEDLKRYLSETDLVKKGPNTITTSEGIIQELKKIRKTGLSIDNEEFVPMLRCVAAPIFGYSKVAKYAVSISAPVSRMTQQRIDEIKKSLQKAAAIISTEIGGAYHSCFTDL